MLLPLYTHTTYIIPAAVAIETNRDGYSQRDKGGTTPM